MTHKKTVVRRWRAMFWGTAILLTVIMFSLITRNETAAQKETSTSGELPKAAFVPTEVYNNNFESTVGNEWRNVQTNQIPATSVTPVGARRFLGEFGNNEIRLSLNNLPAHNRVSVVFDLYMIRSWDGNDGGVGPDIFKFGYNGQTTMQTTFSSNVHNQAYPSIYPGGNYPFATGASEINTLGYSPDFVYQISQGFSHTDNSLIINFSVNGNIVSPADESWGIDNVRVIVDTLANDTQTTLMPYESGGYRYQILPMAQTVPAGFELPNYNDSAWSVGQASFGYNDGCVFPFNLKTHWQTNTRLILRKNVYVPPGATNLGVKLSVDNDIEKIWFNGTEIAGLQPNNNCPLRDEYGYSIPQNLVQTGNNLIAYQVLDRGRQTFFDSRIVADYPVSCSTPTNGLVSWWKAEDGFFQDFNTNTNGMTLAVGNWSLVNGQLQNGANGFATINVASQTNPKLTALVTAQSLVSEGPQLFFKDATVNEIYVDYYANGGTLRLIKNGSVLSSNPALLPLNTQTEMSLEVNGSTVTGKLGTTTVSATTTFIQPFTVFAIGGYANGESGLWDDLRLSGSLARDSAGTNNGTLQNGATFAAGKVGQAFSFDGVDDAISTSATALNNAFASLTIEAWVFPITHGNSSQPTFGRVVVSKTEFDGFALRLQNGLIQADLRLSSGDAAPTFGSALPLNQWSHIAVTYDGAALKAFLNGSQVGNSVPASGTIRNTANSAICAMIGNEPTTNCAISPSGFGFDGRIDELKIYNRALSATEVYNDYAAGNSQTCQLNSTSKPFDFDGDGKADVSVFRPDNGAWYLQQSTNGFTGLQFGAATDKLVPADYDGDGKTDVAVYRSGIWYLQRSQLGFTGVTFGDGSDIPQPADYDGDGRSELAVFRPSNGTWYVLNLVNNQFNALQFGQNGDKPVVADYDGDGKADYAVYRGGTWYLQRSALGFTGVPFGDANDKPVPADYDGDGKADVAVFRPSNGVWYLLRSQLGFTGVQFGLGTDLPTPADYDGDGKTDVAVFRNGIWYLNRSTAGFTGVAFGTATDKPIPNAFVP